MDICRRETGLAPRTLQSVNVCWLALGQTFARVCDVPTKGHDRQEPLRRNSESRPNGSDVTEPVSRRLSPESGSERDGAFLAAGLPRAEGRGLPEPAVEALNACGLADETTVFAPLTGGRSNHLWKFSGDGRNLVFKLYTDRATPLFPNDPNAEMLVLNHVGGTGIGPQPVTFLRFRDRTALVYEFVEGQPWQGDVTAVGALLARLHAIPPPDGLRTVHQGGRAIIDAGNRMLSRCGGPDVRRLLRLRPEPPDVPDAPRVFLHGDAVPDNLIDSPHGLRLIDWQCPARGDPAEDLAVFLSPAMQALSGRAALSKAEKSRFLDSFGNPALSERFHALAPAFHWRNAAYCLWQSAQGETDYLAGFKLECELLEKLAEQDTCQRNCGAERHQDN